MSNLLYNLAQPFSDTKQYTQGTIVVHNDRMYEMTASDYTPGAFNPEKFTERFLSEMISGKLNSNLGDNVELLSSGNIKSYKVLDNFKYLLIFCQGCYSSSNSSGLQVVLSSGYKRIISSKTEQSVNDNKYIPANSYLVEAEKDSELIFSGGNVNAIFIYGIK